MRPTLDPHAADRPAGGGPRKTARRALLVFALSPLLFELGCLCVARWLDLFGPPRRVETPVLDFLGLHGPRVVGPFAGALRDLFRMLPWRADYTVGALVGVSILGMLVLVSVRGNRK